MPNQEQWVVDLPHLTPYVKLPHSKARVLSLIIDAGAAGISSIQLFENGCISIQNAVSHLRKLGASIETERRDATDAHGDIHRAVAHYVYLGWNHSSTQSRNGENLEVQHG